MTPKRIQRKRTKGWKMPQNTVYVGRGTSNLWGNPFKAYENGRAYKTFSVLDDEGNEVLKCRTKQQAIRGAITRYKSWLLDKNNYGRQERLADIRGKDLACWCPLDQPCHADILLELANA